MSRVYGSCRSIIQWLLLFLIISNLDAATLVSVDRPRDLINRKVTKNSESALSSKENIRFVHIPKTGGTTLHLILRDRFSDEQIYPNRKMVEDERLAVTSKEVMNVLLSELPDINHIFVSGHFPIWFFENKDPFFSTGYYFTVLRDPVERVLSHLRYRNSEAAAKGELLITDLPKISPNLMCRTLSSDCTLEGSKLLANAMKNLAKMDFIIFMDDFDQGVQNLFKEIGFESPTEIPHYNTTEKFSIENEVIEKIKKDNNLDIQLYKYAKRYLKYKSKAR